MDLVVWLPYKAQPWDISLSKLVFKAAAREFDIPTPAHWEQLASVSAPFLIKRVRGAFGYGMQGPFRASEAATRRLDITDEGLRKGIEYKTGYQSASADNLWELQRDAELVNLGWHVEWVFRDSASQPLLDALDKAGIKYKVGP